MKKILLGLSLIMLGVFARAQQGLENILVEKYYISDANDAAGATGFGDALPVGSTTYRIYVDMLPGYKFQAAYGTQDVSLIPLHTLKLMTTTSFYNNTDRGHEIPSFSKTNAALHTTMLDSYFSCGAACATSAGPTYNYGILKADDGAAGGANVVNANGILQNNDPDAGIPLTTADGIYGVSTPVVSSVTFVGMAQQQLDFDAGPSSSSFISSNASWASLAGATGPTSDNRVLIGQFTTNGCFSFELNIQIGTPTGGVQKYVARNATGNEILFPACLYNTATVSIAPTPAGPVCAGATVTYTASITGGGASPVYQWIKNGSNVGTNSSTYTTTVAANDQISCVLTSNLPCVTGSPATSNTVTIYAPASAAAVSGCEGTSIALAGSPAGGTYSVANPYSGPGTTYTYSLTDANGCSTTSAPANITVNPLPTVTADDVSGCVGSPVALTGTPAGGSWTLPNPYSGTATSYQHIYTDGNGCTNSSPVATITRFTLPSTSISGNASFCTGSNSVLNSNATAGSGTITGYQWKLGVNNISGATDATYPAIAGGSYTVVVTNSNGCSKTSTAFAVAENPLPTVTASNVSGCTGSSIALSGTPAGGTFSVANPYTGPSTTYTHSFTDGNGCSNTSAAANITVIASPATPSTITGQKVGVCPGSQHIYSVTNVAGLTYNWTPPANASISSGQGTNSVTVDFLAGFTPGNLTVNATNVSLCTSANRVLSLTSLPSTPGTITGQATAVCPLSQHAYSVANVAGVTYNWIPPANASISSGQGTNSVTVDFLAGFANSSLSVNATYGCGNSANRVLALKAIPSTPGTITGQSTAVCPLSQHTYSLVNVAGVTYNWTPPANASISSGQGTNSVTVDFLAGFATSNLSVNATYGCGNSADRVITLKSVPSTPGTITGQSTVVCPTTQHIYSVVSAAGVTYNWTPPANASIFSGQGTNSVTVDFLAGFTSGSLSVNGTYGCGSNSANRNLAISSVPSMPGTITGAKNGVCGLTSVSYSVVNVAGLTYTWSAPSGAIITGGQGTNAITVDFSASVASGSVSVYASNACGNSVLRNLPVTTLPGTASAPTGSTSVCANQVGVPYSIPPIAGAASYVWTVPAGSTVASGQGSTNITVDFGTTGGKVKVYASNACGNGVSKYTTVTISCREVANAEGNEATDLNVYPNPTSGEVTVEYTSTADEHYYLQVLDMSGRTLLNKEADAIEGVNLVKLDLSSYAKGIYMIKFSSATKNVEQRIAVQ